MMAKFTCFAGAACTPTKSAKTGTFVFVLVLVPFWPLIFPFVLPSCSTLQNRGIGLYLQVLQCIRNCNFIELCWYLR